jgi:hypothetical protein
MCVENEQKSKVAFNISLAELPKNSVLIQLVLIPEHGPPASITAQSAALAVEPSPLLWGTEPMPPLVTAPVYILSNASGDHTLGLMWQALYAHAAGLGMLDILADVIHNDMPNEEQEPYESELKQLN